MKKYIIKGGNKLEGEVKISGSKNASLPIIASTILNKGTTVLENVPNIHDTQLMFEILETLGAKIKKKENKYIINSNSINKYEIDEHLMRQIRSSVILAGALIGRYKKANFTYPGGCDIGARPINLHLKNLEKLGIKIDIDQDYENLICSCDKIVGEKIELDFPSVGATENLILATCLAEGTTEILNAAMEPEIIDLQNCLNEMGAKVKGAGTSKIVIEGVKELNRNIKYKIMADRIETGTFLCAAAITGSNICLKEADSYDILPVINKLEETGCRIESKEKEIQIFAPKHLRCVDFTTMPYPGFPTDMQSIFASILTIAKGTSVIVENIFENRYKYISELNKMGAKIRIEGKVATIKGVRRLYGTEVKSVDLRGGAALVIAALSTRNITQVLDIEYILRGYENLDKKLQKIGADIKLEEI